MNLPIHYSKANPKTRKRCREQYVKEQHNKCMFCNKSLDDKPAEGIQSAKIELTLFPPGFFKYPIHLQHNHDTDLTEGAVHAKCNAYLWQYEGR